MSTTLIEKDPAPTAILLILVVLLLLGGGLGFAYMNGVFAATTVIENNKTIETKTVVLPAPTPIVPVDKPATVPAH